MSSQDYRCERQVLIYAVNNLSLPPSHLQQKAFSRQQ
jgi:hypothetical protein